MRIEDIDVIMMTVDEQQQVNGGDDFLRDLGQLFGKGVGALWLGLKSFSEAQERELDGISGPSARRH